ncbi:hypothetical protein WICMUC_002680 [Wickerhamomyces mucosus]|uniref:Protein kinase domain-containing protein n=1 Tax=Wickerhamomyces mucosus TaxID=1378264 RepID=A0A9P8TEN5_9ASCO|nr:hypothetical protein WICMUC_002680 [Wickerhamomyces mucosus]
MSIRNKFLDQNDSDDDGNDFEPPILSEYALALLQREKQNTLKLPKKVNFSKIEQSNIIHDQDSNQSDNNNNNNNNNINHNITSHTNQSESESIFTKNVNNNNNVDDIISSPINQLKTPIDKFTSLSNEQNSFHNIGSKSSIRRKNRIFGSLGPPKRASYQFTDDQQNIMNKDNDIQDDSQINSLEISSPEIYDNQKRNLTKIDELSTQFSSIKTNNNNNNNNNNNSTPKKSLKHYQSPTSQSKIFDFEGLNPYQYSKKHNLSSNDLPKLVQIYFDQQKSELKDNLAINSPIRLKEVMQNKIDKELNDQLSNSLKSEKENLYKVEDLKKIPSTNRKPLGELEIFNNNNTNLNTNNNNNKSKFKQQQQPEYMERHYKQTQPLKPEASNVSSKFLNINGKQYEKLELLGKGGSSKVFKVKSSNNRVYAIKKITFDEFDDSSIIGFKGEIELLNKLRGEDRVVKLIDHSLQQSSLLVVMECGDIDLSHVLQKRLDYPLDVEFIRFHSNEILKCVKAVHDSGIVHSDLKPANFLFVKGVLKIIDFGIANAVPENTVNIYRDSQIGTPNYMAPEALIDNEKSTTWKVGKPSDIWSCGCIIYQMVYGRPPYGGYQGSKRLLAIMNPDIKIPYPEKGLGAIKIPNTLLETIQQCLIRDPNKRLTVDQLLTNPFCKPRIVTQQFINDLVKNAITYGISKDKIDDKELTGLANDVWRRVSNLSL